MFSYHVLERARRFFEVGRKVFRANESYRRTVDRRTGDTVCEELIMRNQSQVRYPAPRDYLTGLPETTG